VDDLVKAVMASLILKVVVQKVFGNYSKKKILTAGNLTPMSL